MPPPFYTWSAPDQCPSIPHENSPGTPSIALDSCVPAKPSLDTLGLRCRLRVACQARLGPSGLLPRINRAHIPFGKSSILLFKPAAAATRLFLNSSSP